MQDIAVMGVSSVPVVGAKMALYVGATDTWLTKHKDRRQNTYFFMHAVTFHSVPTENASFAPTTGRLDTPITAHHRCISG